MKFFEYPDIHTTLRTRLATPVCMKDPLPMYEEFVSDAGLKAIKGSYGYTRDIQIRACAEWVWWKDLRPYFNVYPSIFTGLQLLEVEKQLASAFTSPKFKSVAVLFPEYVATNHGRVSSLLVSILGDKTHRDGDFISVLAITPDHEDPVGNFLTSGLWVPHESSHLTVEDLVTKADRFTTESGKDANELLQEDTRKILRLGLGILLMQSDPDVVTPNILNADRDRYDRTEDPERRQQLAERAIRRTGRVGFDVGRNIETSPHLRRGHLALFHTGKNREVPVIKWRKPCVVKRQKLTEVPTGFLGAAE